MAIVKGTKQHRVRVIEDRPFLRWLIIFACVGLAALAVYLSFHRGHSLGIKEQVRAEKEIADLNSQLGASLSRVTELEQKVANFDLGAEVDRKANEEIRQEVIALKEEIAKLEEDNTFYRGLMAPTKNKQGLTFGTVELSQTDKPRVINFRVVMQQLAVNHNLLKGALQFTIVGRQDGVDTSYTLRQLSKQISKDKVTLRFKYFQTIEGELTLPAGFEPLAIELVANSTGKNAVTVEKRFGWLVEEVL
ncbi:MAG: hypothetical protein K6L76_09175 [Agarilytica sp.]